VITGNHLKFLCNSVSIATLFAQGYTLEDSMIDNRDNLNRPVDRRADRAGWGLPLGIAALALIAGLVFFNWSGDRTTTASNTNRPTTTLTTPMTPPATTPAPATRPSTGG
jgi:hypothetical protein